MKKNLLLTILLATLSLSSFSQTSKEKVVELFQLMQTDKIMDATMDNITVMMGQQGDLLKNNVGNKAYDEYISFVVQEGKVLGRKIMNEDMAALYSKYFTSDEIQKFIDFYSTPAGKKMIDMTPALQKEFTTSFGANDMPAFMLKCKTKIEELNKKYPNSVPAPVKN